ncbi:Predicted arabinose efflux permease, MFS family [Brevibacterium sandarakinum]|uniref:Predicted arabinose efflux permease, MFS family n=1 Tax=Brevibacterium sandarakinum TaxID=629680 RepID=A0A1H1UL39_BRESA|nr:MFS transporter [Brevibacterium sandarakinum]SDS73222.1 Predicted arabinose efflux permease, MFS family [Brevibacterium sandarakinum]
MKTRTRAQAKLITAQLLSGAGIASGYAVGGLLAEEITGKTSMAGIAQMSVILGAGLIAYPLAVLAGKAGRRTALTLGFGIGTLGATVVLLGVALQFLPLFMLGMMMCGSSTASGLQARYAAVDLVDPSAAGRAMSLVVWATTVGSVLGPSFTAPGAHLGAALGMNELAGPYLISMTAFGLATLVASTLTRKITPGVAEAVAESGQSTTEPATMKLGPALRFAAARPVPLFAMITIIAGQMMMTNVMVMTPVHMDHQAFSLGAIGIVVSVHIAGMYALSPVFGWMADRFGPGTVIAGGVAVFAAAITLGVVDAAAEVSSMVLLSTALIFLGIGWSMFLIGGSALLTASVPRHAKVTLQGASDSAMNLGGALMAAMAGTVLQAGGFLWINMMATVVLLIALAFSIRAIPLMRWPGQMAPADPNESTAEASYAD